MDAQKLQSPMCSKTIFKVIPKSEAVRTDVPNKFVDEIYLKYPNVKITGTPNISSKQFQRQRDQTSQYKFDYVNYWKKDKPIFIPKPGRQEFNVPSKRLPEDNYRPNIRNPISAIGLMSSSQSKDPATKTTETFQHIDPKELVWGSIYSKTIDTTAKYIIDNKLHLINSKTQ